MIKFLTEYRLSGRQYLQAFLSQYEHEKIDEVSRYKMVEDPLELVHEMVGGDIPVGVPQRPSERVLAPVALGDLQDITPGGRLVVPCVHVVHRNDVRPSNKTIEKSQTYPRSYGDED